MQGRHASSRHFRTAGENPGFLNQDPAMESLAIDSGGTKSSLENPEYFAGIQNSPAFVRQTPFVLALAVALHIPSPLLQ
jgi:hypothetical protein